MRECFQKRVWFVEETFPKGEGTNKLNKFARKHNVQLITRYFLFQPELGNSKRIAELIIRHQVEEVVSIIWDHFQCTTLLEAKIESQSPIYRQKVG